MRWMVTLLMVAGMCWPTTAIAHASPTVAAPLASRPTAPAAPTPAPTRNWDDTDHRIRAGMIATGVQLGVGVALTTAGVTRLGVECYWSGCYQRSIRRMVATGAAISVASVASISALAGLRRTARRVRTWSSGDPERYYRRSRLMAGFGIGAGAGIGVAVAGGAASAIGGCIQDFCYHDRVWVPTLAVGATVVAGSVIGLSIAAAQRRRHRGSSPTVMFTGTGLSGRF